MELREKETGEVLGTWTHDGQLMSAKQMDGSSCGAFVMLVIMSLIFIVVGLLDNTRFTQFLLHFLSERDTKNRETCAVLI